MIKMIQIQKVSDMLINLKMEVLYVKVLEELLILIIKF